MRFATLKQTIKQHHARDAEQHPEQRPRVGFARCSGPCRRAHRDLPRAKPRQLSEASQPFNGASTSLMIPEYSVLSAASRLLYRDAGFRAAPKA